MYALRVPTLRSKLVAIVVRAYPFLSGCGSLANSSVVRRAAGDSAEQVWAHGPGGRVLVPLNDYVGRAAYFAGDLDRKVTRMCRMLVRPGDTVLDIGANYGLVTTLLAGRVGDRGAVHAFEPNPRVLDSLRETLRRHPRRCVTLHECALGPREETLTLVAPKANAGAGSLSRSAQGGGTSYSVPVRVLDDIVEELGFDSIRFIKIDVEGHEPQVLRGAARTLSTIQPTCILFELNDRETAPAQHPTIDMLAGFGYRLFSIPRSLVRLRVEPLDLSAERFPRCHDYLAVAPVEEGDGVIAQLGLAGQLRRVQSVA